MLNDEQPGVCVAMVALDSARFPTPERLAATLSTRGDDARLADVGDEQEVEPGIIMLRIDDALLAVSLMPAPIPWGDLEGPCETAWWWPEATESLQRHTHHLIAALMGGALTRLEQHVLLTRVVAALLLETDAAGVYWGAGTVVHEPAMFLEESAHVSVERPTPHLWIDSRIVRQADGTFTFFTTGMNAFGRMEIEIDRTSRHPGDILEFTHGVIAYLLTSDNTVAVGETIGRHEHERVLVTQGPSIWQRAAVMKLDFQ